MSYEHEHLFLALQKLMFDAKTSEQRASLQALLALTLELLKWLPKHLFA